MTPTLIIICQFLVSERGEVFLSLLVHLRCLLRLCSVPHDELLAVVVCSTLNLSTILEAVHIN